MTELIMIMRTDLRHDEAKRREAFDGWCERR